MSGRGWSRWLGPPIAVGVIAVILSQVHPGAEAGGRVTPPPAGACAASPIATDAKGQPKRDAAPGSWWKLGDRLDRNGALAGRRLAVGRGGSTSLVLDLPVESVASGPIGGVVVIAADDQRQSEIRFVSVLDACSWPVATSGDVVRGAILDPTDGSVLTHIVDRASRADLGTWRFRAPGALTEPVLVAPALPAGMLDGPIWATDLRLDPTGRLLAVQSCTDTGCLTRVFDLHAPAAAPAILRGGGPGDTGADSAQGPMLGFANGKLLAWAQCPGFPCSILSWDLTGGASSVVVARADAAAVTPNGRFLVATTDATTGRSVRLDLVAGTLAVIRGIHAGELPLPVGVAATSGVQLGPDEIAVGAVGATPRSFRPAAAEVIP